MKGGLNSTGATVYNNDIKFKVLPAEPHPRHTQLAGGCVRLVWVVPSPENRCVPIPLRFFHPAPPATLSVALCVSVWEKPTLVYSSDSTEERWKPVVCFKRARAVGFQPLDTRATRAFQFSKGKTRNTLKEQLLGHIFSFPLQAEVVLAGELETRSLAWHKSGVFFQLQIPTDGREKSEPSGWKFGL